MLAGFRGAFVLFPELRVVLADDLRFAPPQVAVSFKELHLVPQPLHLAGLGGNEVEERLGGVKVSVGCAQPACDAGELLLLEIPCGGRSRLLGAGAMPQAGFRTANRVVSALLARLTLRCCPALLRVPVGAVDIVAHSPLNSVVTYTVASLGTECRWSPMRRVLVSVEVSRVMEWSVPLRHRPRVAKVGRVTVLPRSLALRCLTIMPEACDRTRESCQGDTRVTKKSGPTAFAWATPRVGDYSGVLAFDDLKVAFQPKFADRDYLEVADFKHLPGVLLLKEDIFNCGVTQKLDGSPPSGVGL